MTTKTTERRTVIKDGPRNIDIHVGQRLRMRRNTLGMTQDQLAKTMGITFQQIQKYERGFNRISASRIWDAAQALEVPVAYFFDEVDTANVSQTKMPTKISVEALTKLNSLPKDLQRTIAAHIDAVAEMVHPFFCVQPQTPAMWIAMDKGQGNFKKSLLNTWKKPNTTPAE